MKIATWNINSIRTRLERLRGWLAQERPDAICLQETKVEDEQFPAADLERDGYRVELHGQRAYNGVAVLARSELGQVQRGFADGEPDEQARFIAASIPSSGAGSGGDVRVMSAYVPNGKTVGHDDYEFKLRWLGRLRAFLDRHCDPAQPLVLCGDFNVTRDDRDVHDPTAWAGENLCSEPERRALERLLDWGLVDLFRERHADPGFYSWWDYRMLGFQKNRGLRIDYIFATRPLVDRLVDVRIDRQARKGAKPSDHAPVIAEFRD